MSAEYTCCGPDTGPQRSWGYKDEPIMVTAFREFAQRWAREMGKPALITHLSRM